MLGEEEHLEGGSESEQLQLPVEFALLARDAVHHLGYVVKHTLELGLELGDRRARLAVHPSRAEQHALVERAEHPAARRQDVGVQQPTHQRPRPGILNAVLPQRKVHHPQRRRSLTQRPQEHHEREVQVT